MYFFIYYGMFAFQMHSLLSNTITAELKKFQAINKFLTSLLLATNPNPWCLRHVAIEKPLVTKRLLYALAGGVGHAALLPIGNVMHSAVN
jgi:hypothetical protein